MKNRIYSFVVITLSLFGVLSATAQGNDDLYFDGVDNRIKRDVKIYEPAVKSNDYDRLETGDDDYVDDRYENEYSARVRRFHQPARGFSYYSNYYVDNYWYDPYAPGTNIYVMQPFYSYNSWGWSYPQMGWNSYGQGWGGHGGFYGNNFGYSPYWGSNWGNAQWGNQNPYWSGYNQGFMNGYNQGFMNGWYTNNNNMQGSNNWNSWFESSAPNAGNFVTNRSPRSTDTGIHRSRNTPVPGYDTQQRYNSSDPQNNGLSPDKIGRGRNVQPNTNIRPDRNVNPNVREPNVRPNTRQPQPDVRPDTRQPNIRQPERNINPPTIRENNPSRSGNLNPPSRITPERSRDHNSSFNNSGIKGSGFSSGSSSSGSSSSGRSGSSSTPSSSGRSGGGGRR